VIFRKDQVKNPPQFHEKVVRQKKAQPGMVKFIIFKSEMVMKNEVFQKGNPGVTISYCHTYAAV
jgi:hypothetical protein